MVWGGVSVSSWVDRNVLVTSRRESLAMRVILTNAYAATRITKPT